MEDGNEEGFKGRIGWEIVTGVGGGEEETLERINRKYMTKGM